MHHSQAGRRREAKQKKKKKKKARARAGIANEWWVEGVGPERWGRGGDDGQRR